MSHISFEHEHLDHYDGQDNYELGIYEDGEVMGYVQYTIYDNILRVSDILVRPKRRREGFGSMLIQKMKRLHPDATYEPSYKTELGSLFVHKDVDVNENVQRIKKMMGLIVEQVTNLTREEQTLLGALNRFLLQPSLGSGEKNKIENVPTDQLIKTTSFEKNRIHPMVQALLIKKNTGKVTYNQNEFNALYGAVLNGKTEEQKDQLFKEGGTITKVNYSAQY